MKYTISRQFSFTKEKFHVVSNARTVCTATASSSQEHNGRYTLKFSSAHSKHSPEGQCLARPDQNKSQSYQIYIKNDQTHQTTCFAQLSYELCGHQNYLYTIILGEKLYQVRSCDLKDRRLTLIDTLQSTDTSRMFYPETLFQVTDSFSKGTKTYHVTIDDVQYAYGYLAIIILLNLHECQRASIGG